jgi:hypothetical protein
MKLYTKKYLFYKCYVNSYYSVVRAAFNLSICRADIQGIQTQSVITVHITDENIDGLCSSVYSRCEGTSVIKPSPAWQVDPGPGWPGGWTGSGLLKEQLGQQPG